MNRWARQKGSSGGIKRRVFTESTHESLSTQNTCGAGVPHCRQCWMLSSCLALRPCRTVLGDVLVVDLGGRGLVHCLVHADGSQRAEVLRVHVRVRQLPGAREVLLHIAERAGQTAMHVRAGSGAHCVFRQPFQMHIHTHVRSENRSCVLNVVGI